MLLFVGMPPNWIRRIMSKAILRRTLAQMDAAQISQLLIELYSARPEARDYLEFFLNPDIDARLEKARTNIRKELLRSSRGRSKARITRLKEQIKSISSLNPGDEYVLEISLYTFCLAAGMALSLRIPDTFQKSIARLMVDTVDIASRSGLLAGALSKITVAVDSITERTYASCAFKTLLHRALEQKLSDLSCRIDCPLK